MQPFDHAWRLLKSYTSEPARTLDDTDRHVRLHRVAGKRNLGLPLSLTREDLNDRQPRPLPFPEDHPGLAEYYAPTKEEIEQMQAEEDRWHREEMQREYMDDLERRIDAGEVTPTDIFDEGGNAAAGEGYMSGGRQY